MDLNARSVLAATRAAHPWLKRQGGFIINTTSIAARNGGGNGAILYAAAKGFVSTITHGHAKEFVADRIRVNAVAPGVIATPFHDRYTNPEQLETQRKTIPMGFVGTPEHCVGAYLFLASDVLSVTSPDRSSRSTADSSCRDERPLPSESEWPRWAHCRPAASRRNLAESGTASLQVETAEADSQHGSCLKGGVVLAVVSRSTSARLMRCYCRPQN